MHHALVSSFEGLLKDGTHPGYFLFLTIDPQSIDINIHPTKTEIKFDDEHAIYAMLRASVKHSLGQFSIAPVLDFNKDAGLDTPYSYATKAPVVPTIEVDRSFNPFHTDDAESGKQKSKYSAQRTSFQSSTNASWEAMYVGLKNEETQLDAPAIDIESEEVTGSLFSSEEQLQNDITFQLQNKYIISPIKSGVMVIHQNLAHQRVLYEKFLKNIPVKEAISQQLLFPLQLQFSTLDIAILKGIQEQLENMGFG